MLVRFARGVAILVLLQAAGCGSQSDGASSADASTPSRADASSPAEDGTSTTLPPGYVPQMDTLDLRCKLISDAHLDDPTANDTHYRANVRGSDLGIPVVLDDSAYFFFGDTAGAQNIWPLGPESLPDAVGYANVPYSELAANPDLLCSELRFLVTGGASGAVESDFAAAHMTAPPGESITDYIRNPAGPRGAASFPNLPGDFEVPSGGFAHDGSIYLFYTIINHDPFEMRGSYLARWTAPSTDGLPNYDILYHVDQRFSPGGPLGGDFINIAALVEGEYIYMYGTGQYRNSPVHLARKRLAELSTAGGFERFDPEDKTWGPGDIPAGPIVDQPNVGELSVQYFPEIDRYVMLDQEVSLGNRIAARFAEKPEGPWSEAVTVATMGETSFADRYCCVGTDCSGDGLIECDQPAGFYGTYMLPDAIVHSDNSFTITFLVSTWIPYNVALMSASFK